MILNELFDHGWIALPHHTLTQGSIRDLYVFDSAEDAYEASKTKAFDKIVERGTDYYWPIVETDNHVHLILGLSNEHYRNFKHLYGRVRVLAYGPTQEGVAAAAQKAIEREPILAPQPNIYGKVPGTPFWIYKTMYKDGYELLKDDDEAA